MLDDAGKRNITTRSSSKLDASSGIVSGNTQSLGDDTHDAFFIV